MFTIIRSFQRAFRVADEHNEAIASCQFVGLGDNDKILLAAGDLIMTVENGKVDQFQLEEMAHKVFACASLSMTEDDDERIDTSGTFSPTSTASLFMGDCLDLLRQIPDESIQLVATSPPYNIGKEYEETLDIDNYVEQQRRVINECVRVLHPKGSICWQVGNYIEKGEIVPLDMLLYSCFKDNGLKMRNRIIWHFGHGLHCTKRFSGRYETINWFTKSDDYIFDLDPIRVPQKYPGKKHFEGPKKGQYSGNPKGKNPTDVWDIPNVKANHIEKTIHPCQFPISLVQRLVLSMTTEGDFVLDPFLGVGSTVIASVLNNRKGVGAEITGDYFQLAFERVKAALDGTLSYREDKPVYVPTKNVTLTMTPWFQDDREER